MVPNIDKMVFFTSQSYLHAGLWGSMWLSSYHSHICASLGQNCCWVQAHYCCWMNCYGYTWISHHSDTLKWKNLFTFKFPNLKIWLKKLIMLIMLGHYAVNNLTLSRKSLSNSLQDLQCWVITENNCWCKCILFICVTDKFMYSNKFRNGCTSLCFVSLGFNFNHFKTL